MREFLHYTDQELWSLVQLNNRSAFEAIYKRHWSKLMLAAYNVLKDQETCKDIVQDVFSDLWLRRKTTFISSFPAYSKIAVRNRVFKHFRRGNIEQEHLDGLDTVSFVNATEQMVNFNLLQDQYDKCVSELPNKCRQVFLLSRVENLSIKEISTRLNISPKTVEKQITKALKRLRASMTEALPGLLLAWFL